MPAGVARWSTPMDDGLLQAARKAFRIAWRKMRRELDVVPVARLLCMMNVHARSQGGAYKVKGEWQTECRRCKCAMIRSSASGAWRKK